MKHQCSLMLKVLVRMSFYPAQSSERSCWTELVTLQLALFGCILADVAQF